MDRSNAERLANYGLPDKLEEAAHSKLGASSADRWMACPGSVALVGKMGVQPSDEEDWRIEGQVAHLIGAQCLSHNFEPWELIGCEISGVTIDQEMVRALNIYVGHGRRYLADKRYAVRIESMVQFERSFGTVDLGTYDDETHTIEINDLKYGVGIMVEVERNPQLMCYAYGFLQDFPDARSVKLRIIQPRITWAAPIREWEISVEDLCAWVERELIPAMNRTDTDQTLWPGEHCRFCPAKMVCPALKGLYAAAARANPAAIVEMSDADLGRDYEMRQAVKSYLKAQEAMVYNRLMGGHPVPGAKLVSKKADRVFKEGAETVLKANLGDEIYSAPELKSPAQVEKLSSVAKDLVRQWAHTPASGYTVALDSDGRMGIKLKTLAETFAHVDAPAQT